MSFVLLPLPFLYKCIVPKYHSQLCLISNGLRKRDSVDVYTSLRLDRKTLRIVLMILLVILTIALFILVMLFKQPDRNWMLYVIFIQYASYIVWYSLWGLVCCLIKKMKNDKYAINRIPDWRVEMVFQDLLVMN